jgi:hypothetical protein
LRIFRPVRQIGARSIVAQAYRFGSDLTDAEWAILEPYLPPCRHERKRKWSMRRIVEAMFDVRVRASRSAGTSAAVDRAVQDGWTTPATASL